MQRNNSLLETERTVLAVLLNDSHAIIPVMGVLEDADSFSESTHSAIYGAVLDLTKAGIVPNAHTVADKLPSVGLDALQDIGRRFNTKANREVVYLAEIVAKHGKQRRIQGAIKSAGELAQEDTTDLDGLAFLAMQMIAGAVDGKTERDAGVTAVNERLDTEIAQLEGLADGELIGFDTGSPWLNEKSGGLCQSHVWIVSGPYKGRKTTFARNMVIAACKAGASVDVFALEGDQGSTAAGLRAMLATEKLHRRGYADEMLLSETFVRRGRRSEAQRAALDEARQEINGWNLRIYDGRDGIGTADKIAHKVKRDRFMFGMNVFVVDYLQLLGAGKLFERLEGSTQAMQRLIVEEGVTGILLAQLNEATIGAMGSEGNDSYSPGIKGGGDVPAAADFLIRTRYDADDSPDKLTVQLKLARHAQPGTMRYEINPQSGRILKELGATK